MMKFINSPMVHASPHLADTIQNIGSGNNPFMLQVPYDKEIMINQILLRFFSGLNLTKSEAFPSECPSGWVRSEDDDTKTVYTYTQRAIPEIIDPHAAPCVISAARPQSQPILGETRLSCISQSLGNEAVSGTRFFPSHGRWIMLSRLRANLL